MNLQEQWKELEKGDEDLSSLLTTGLPSKPSNDPLQKIKKSLMANSIIGAAISVGYIFILIKFPVWQVLLCIGIVLLFTLWAITKALLLYADIRRHVVDRTLLTELKRHYDGIASWIRIQERAGWLIYPVSTAGGFVVGGTLGAGKPIDEVMKEPVMLIALLVSIAILVPLCFYVAKLMCKKAFGKYAEQLKANIETLQHEATNSNL